MSQTGTVGSLENLAEEVVSVVGLLAPVVEAAVPASAAAISIGTKIAQGVLAAEPAAVALYDQIKGGVTPTSAQLAQYASDYEAAYQQLDSDVKAQLNAAAMRPAASS